MFTFPSSSWYSDFFDGNGTLEGDLDIGLLDGTVNATEPGLDCNTHGKYNRL